MRRNLYNNILLTGSNAFFPGIVSRIYKELRCTIIEKNYSAKDKRIRFPIDIFDGSEISNYHYLSFYEAADFANVYNDASFNKYWISKQDYEESGPNIIYKKLIMFKNNFDNLNVK